MRRCEFAFWLFWIVVWLVFHAWMSGAFAHGEADWIMKNEKTSGCCGPQDCMELPEGAVLRDYQRGGYVLNSRWFPEIGAPATEEFGRETYPSINENYWACFVVPAGDRESGYSPAPPLDVHKVWQTLPPRCLFAPPEGY
jgi:hypothetical protein